MPHVLLAHEAYRAMPGKERLAFHIMLAGANRKRGLCFWSIARLAEETKVSLNTVKRMVRYCKRTGLATRERKGLNGRLQWAFILPPWLAQAMRFVGPQGGARNGPDINDRARIGPQEPNDVGPGLSPSTISTIPTGESDPSPLRAQGPPHLATPSQSFPGEEVAPSSQGGQAVVLTDLSPAGSEPVHADTLGESPQYRGGHVRPFGQDHLVPNSRVPAGYAVAAGPSGFIPENLANLLAVAPQISVPSGGVCIEFQDGGRLGVYEEDGGYTIP